jgi:hypothetical protein
MLPDQLTDFHQTDFTVEIPLGTFIINFRQFAARSCGRG